MRNLLIIALGFFFLVACNNENNKKTDYEQYVQNEFVFNGRDTCVYDFTYGKYIPSVQIDSTSNLATAKYVRYHDYDTTAIIFSKNYIVNLCLSSRCVMQEKQDTIFGYGKVKEIYFPEAYLGFAYDEFEEMIVYSFINFADDLWFTDISTDGLSVTSDVETALWNYLPFASDSVLATVKIYNLDEKNGVQLDHTKNIELAVWDLMRSFFQYPMYGIKKDNFIVYSNEHITFVRPYGPEGWNNLSSVFFYGYTIEDETSLELLKTLFMNELKKIPVTDDVFVSGPE